MAAWPESVRQENAGMAALTAALTALTVLLVMGVSSLMLARLGISYEEAGGPAWQKIHPATFAGVLAVLSLCIAAGNPFNVVEDIVRRQPGALVFLAAVAGILFYYSIRFGSPVTQLIDTFILPWMLFILLTRSSQAWVKAAAICLHVFMAVNASLALAEFALGVRITPIVAEGIVLTGDWRSSALLGHPLTNAAAAAMYGFLIVIGGGRELPPWLRLTAVALQVAAMPVYGGRLATGLFLIFGIVAMAYLVWANRDNMRLTPAAAAIGVLSGMASAALAVIAFSAGFFDKFIGRFLDDQGSAAARQSMFDLVARLPEQNFWLGSDPVYVATLQRMQGIPFGIESFWVAMTVYYGLLIAAPFFLCFLYFMYEHARATRPAALWAILLYLLIISGSTALASKTTSLAHFTIFTLVLLRRETRRAEG
jgi:hypothetical protein